MGNAQALVATFPDGHRIQLRSVSSGRTLRITEGGQVDGLGAGGPFAQWIVHHRQYHVMLQNIHNPNWWLAIRDGQLTHGVGGPHCEFIVHHHGGDLVTLRAAHDAGAVGIFPDGNAKPPGSVGEGPHSQFQTLSFSGLLLAMGNAQDLSGLHPHESVVCLKSVSTGHYLRLQDSGEVDALGSSKDSRTHWMVTHHHHHICLKNEHNKHWYLAIRSDQLTHGSGGPHTEFIVHHLGEGLVTMRGAHDHGHVGFYPEGNPKVPSHVQEGKNAQFHVMLAKE